MLTIGFDLTKTADDPIQALANAIVIVAARDYRKALTELRGNRAYTSEPDIYERWKEECEWFFQSDVFSVLTKLDGRQLMLDIQNEVKDAQNNKSRKRKNARAAQDPEQ